MQDAAFEWDEHNTRHIRRHAVAPAEVEAALADPDRLGIDAYNARERRWALLGADADGRILLVVFTMRGRIVRVVTARDATARERRRYRRARR